MSDVNRNANRKFINRLEIRPTMVFLIRRGLSVVVFKVKKLVREIKEVMPRDNRLARRGNSALKRTRKERCFRDFGAMVMTVLRVILEMSVSSRLRVLEIVC